MFDCIVMFVDDFEVQKSFPKAEIQSGNNRLARGSGV